MSGKGKQLASVLLLALLGACQGGPHEMEFPAIRKVLMISIDTLRADAVGAYNREVAHTPNLDRLAAESVVFTDVLSQGPSTAISHKSLFLSVYPSIHRTTVETVPTESLTSPVQALAARGMKTAAFVGGGQMNPRFGFDRYFDSYTTIRSYRPRLEGEDNLELLERLSSNWLDEHAQEDFFLFLHTYEVHCPYVPPEEIRRRHAGWYEGEIDPEGKCGESFYNQEELSEEDLQFVRDL